MLCEVIAALIALIVGIISQYTHVSKHQVVDFKCIQFLFAKELSVRLGEKVPCSALLLLVMCFICQEKEAITNCPNTLTL